MRAFEDGVNTELFRDMFSISFQKSFLLDEANAQSSWKEVLPTEMVCFCEVF